MFLRSSFFLLLLFCGASFAQTSLPVVVERAAGILGVPAKLVEAVIEVESGFDAKAISPKGARGLMQLMPDTAVRFGVTDSFDPEQNVIGGTKYLRFLLDRYDGNIPLVLAAYNAGEGAVDQYEGIPPFSETQLYVENVLSVFHGGGRLFADASDSPHASPILFSAGSGLFFSIDQSDGFIQSR